MPYALTAGPADVGRRVVVRWERAEGGLSDVLGELLRWDDDEVAVRDRRGDERVVPRAAVVAAKRVPPPPVRR